MGLSTKINKRLIAFYGVFISLLLMPVHAYANTHSAGNNALELWNNEGIANSPQWVQYWLIIMMVSLALGLFRLEAY